MGNIIAQVVGKSLPGLACRYVGCKSGLTESWKQTMTVKSIRRHHDIQPNDNQHNDNQQNGLVCDTRHNDIQHNYIYHNDTQY
jgi:hypothetical protein